MDLKKKGKEGEKKYNEKRQEGKEGGREEGTGNSRGTYHAVGSDVLDLERALEGVVIVEDGCEKEVGVDNVERK